MTPTRGPRQRNDRQATSSQRQAGSCYHLPQSPEDSHAYVLEMKSLTKHLSFIRSNNLGSKHGED